ncbi:MAG: PD-(D/E)XK nuclease family protein [Bacteroidales bacterium]|nr:PD-(D/E)XK nuclease family protein [Bacteroidales bacterium]
MKQFLKQVAEHYFATGEISRFCFVFPNRRSQLFFQKWLSDLVRESGKPVLAPAMLTVNDFFYKISGARPVDRINLLLVLYDCYKELNPAAESLDDFIFWGDVLLGDFDDVDKYLVPAANLFTDVSQYKEMQDDFSYLTDSQKEAVKRFLSNFGASGSYEASRQGPVKQRFLQIWNILFPLYSRFRETLRSRGMSYGGMVYRDLAESLQEQSAVDILGRYFPAGTTFVFTGLNALCECEKKVLSRMRDAGIAEFCWDYSSEMIKDPRNRSSFFMRDNVAAYPQAFTPDPEPLGEPYIEVIGVPSSVGCAKQLPRILDSVNPGSLDTAVVLPEESLLIPVLNSIPEQIKDINVTMGYPMQGSAFFALMDELARMQLNLRFKDGRWMFYHRNVWAVFSNSVLTSILDDAGAEVIKQVRKEAKYYIPQEEFSASPLLRAIFLPVVQDPADASGAQASALSEYLLGLAGQIGILLKDAPGMTLELDFARQYYQDLNRLRSKEIAVLPKTFARLIVQAEASRSVPFKGEPLKGLQIMGPLETRALDFENLIILSCNEGVFPRRDVSSSFIPPELRRGFGLPAYEYQDAVWAYYFYRMIQRARRIYLLYDSRTEGLRSGEESRYIKQLELHFGKEFKRVTVNSPIVKPEPPLPIEKTPEDIKVLEETIFSASSIQSYLACPAKFYYSSVKGLEEVEDVEESLQANQIGNVLHKLMQHIYSVKGGVVKADYLKGWAKDESSLKAKIHELIRTELKTPEVTGRNLIFANVICKYAVQILGRDCELLEGQGADSFNILSLEVKDKVDICGRPFKGYIDRLDSLRPGMVRVSDYKTGKVTDQEISIDDGNAETLADKIFSPESTDRPKIAFQLYVYDKIVMEKYPEARIFNSIYPTVRLFKEPVPVQECSKEFIRQMDIRLEETFKEMFDPHTGFRRTSDDKVCSYCDFKMLCGK